MTGTAKSVDSIERFGMRLPGAVEHAAKAAKISRKVSFLTASRLLPDKVNLSSQPIQIMTELMMHPSSSHCCRRNVDCWCMQ